MDTRLIVTTLLFSSLAAAEARAQEWPRFRAPVHFGPDENARWRTGVELWKREAPR